MKLLHSTLAAGMLLAGSPSLPAATPELSRGVYRLPYENGTQVLVANDHDSHWPVKNRYDLVGTGGRRPYKVVAAADGIVRYVVDYHTETGECSDNNYVWLEHPNGEWTKYSHLQTDSASAANKAALYVGKQVCAGTYLGDEDDVGCSQGVGIHCHFEVAVPTDLDNPVDISGGYINGFNRIPVICNIPGNIMIENQIYTANPCNATACSNDIIIPAQDVSGPLVYMADNTIDSNNNAIDIFDLGTVLLTAGNKITLRPGFQTQPGAILRALLRDCNETLGLPGCTLVILP